jgi:hypothetical protein
VACGPSLFTSFWALSSVIQRSPGSCSADLNRGLSVCLFVCLSVFCFEQRCVVKVKGKGYALCISPFGFFSGFALVCYL